MPENRGNDFGAKADIETKKREAMCTAAVGIDRDELLRLGDTNASADPFVMLVGEKMDEEIDAAELLPGIRRARTRIQMADRHAGFGYASASADPDQGNEASAAAYLAQGFRDQLDPIDPVIVPVDQLYRYEPGVLSLVDKVTSLSAPDHRIAIVLSGFFQSDIFTDDVLKQVPAQDNAGLSPRQFSAFGKRLDAFARERLPLMVARHGGDTSAVVDELGSAGDRENARLLVAVGLLLQDKQRWQNLWYEYGEGTPLYVVGPQSFHDAMNRLNMSWGHGTTDYSYRARASLGAEELPLNEDEAVGRYHRQGLRAQAFEEKVGPFLKDA